MKKILTCIVYLFTTQILNAQPFGANNATWHFSIYNILFNTIDPVTVTSSASFVFMGDTCYSLSSNNTGCMTVNPFTVKESNDSVYYYNTASNSFVLLYNYNAMVGDTQTIYVPDFSGTNLSIQMVVTSTSTILVNGVSKKTYSITYLDPSFHYFDFEGTVIEDIGITSFLFPQYGFCDPQIYGFRCFEDSFIGLYNTQPFIECDSVINVGINSLHDENDLKIFPNPCTSILNLDWRYQSSGKINYKVKNVFGQTVLSGIFSSENKISTNELTNGIYFLEVSLKEKDFTRKFLKGDF